MPLFFIITLLSQARRPIASRIASAALKLLIESMCTVAQDVEVDINASSNLALLSGRLNAVTVTSSSLVYNDVAISGGVALYTDEIHLTSKFSATDSLFTATVTPPRLSKPFSVSVRATVTEADLNKKGPLNDALQILLNQIVTTSLSGALGRRLPEQIGGITCTLDSIHLVDTPISSLNNIERRQQSSPFIDLFSFLLRPFSKRNNNETENDIKNEMNNNNQGGNIIMEATANLTSGRVLKFAVRAGISIVDDGNIVKLADPHVIWNGLAIPLITINMIGVELDSTTKITKIIIDKGRLSADGILVISPPSSPSRQLPSSRPNR